MNGSDRRRFIETGLQHYRTYSFNDWLNAIPNLNSPFADFLLHRYGEWGSQWFLVEVATERFRRALAARLDLLPKRRNAGDVLSDNLLAECVREVAEFYSTVPRAYLFYVPLQGVLSAYRGRIDIAKDIWIEEFDESERAEYWQPDLLLDGARVRRDWDLRHRVDTRHPYLCCSAHGLVGRGNREGAAADAFARIEHFLMLSAACESRIPFAPLHESSVRTGFVVDTGLGRENGSPILLSDQLTVALSAWTAYPWPDATVDYLTDCGLPHQAGESARDLTSAEQASALRQWLPLVSSALQPTRRRHQTLNACNWAFHSAYGADPAAGVVLLSIAFEAILQTRDLGKERMAEQLSARIRTSPKEGEGIEKDFVSFYLLRSKIVHGEGVQLRQHERKLYGRLIQFFLRAVARELSG